VETPIIELQDIRKSFGPVEVLKGVNMTVYPGKVTALVGDNGAGKSTLIKGLSGAQPYDSGDVSSRAVRSLSRTPRTPPNMALRSFTKTSRCARTSTSSRTCS
jgi:D-xylose transport system ATP-binding protein